MPPQLFQALSTRWSEQQRRIDLRFGLVAAVIANSAPGRKRRQPVQPSDFFRAPARQMTDDEILETLRSIAEWRRK